MGRVTFDGMGRRLLPKRQTLILTRNFAEKIDGVLLFQDVRLFSTGIRVRKKNSILSVGKQIFQAFEPSLDEVIVTQIHAQVEEIHISLKEFDLSRFETVSSKFYTKDEKNTYDFTIQYRKKRKSMDHVYLVFLQLFLCVICILTGAQAFRKKALWTVCLLWLNAFTNLVKQYSCFYMTLF